MKINHECIFPQLNVPVDVATVIEVKRCPVCGAWWKRASYRMGGYSMVRIRECWPNVKLFTYRRRARKLLG